MERLTGELHTSDLPTRFETALNSALQGKGINGIAHASGEEETARRTPEAILQADIRKVAFTECDKWFTFRVESETGGAFEIRLRNARLLCEI